MVVMALDHVRDNLMPLGDPVDLATTNPALFFTRIATHFCAPTFYFLAGLAAYYASRRRTPAEMSWFLLTRGFWLVVLELTVVRFGWYFAWNFTYFEGLTIWGLGWSMVALAALIRMPRWLLVTVAAAMVLGHNTLDAVKPESFGPAGFLWTILHRVGSIHIGSATLWIAYPLIPWIGVMALGYAFGPDGIRRALRIGPAMILAFILLRFSNLYGDPHPWTYQKNAIFTVMAFLNCEKYPPSLLYLLMTLGPSITVIGLVEWLRPAFTKPVILYGRVPMFYYLLHIYVAHLAGVAVALYRFGNASTLFEMPTSLGNQKLPSNSDLWAVYLTWMLVVILLYPACKWFAAVKARNPNNTWLSYL
jgi:uncharacterized membrane protein